MERTVTGRILLFFPTGSLSLNLEKHPSSTFANPRYLHKTTLLYSSPKYINKLSFQGPASTLSFLLLTLKKNKRELPITPTNLQPSN